MEFFYLILEVSNPMDMTCESRDERGTATFGEKGTERAHYEEGAASHCSSRSRICMEATNLSLVTGIGIHSWGSRKQQ